MPASHIAILILAVTLIALAIFTVLQISVREDRIAKLEVELTHSGIERRQHAARAERLLRRYRTEYDRANLAEDRVLSRNIFDELADEYSWLQFPAVSGTIATVYHFVEPVDAEHYDAALNSHEVK